RTHSSVPSHLCPTRYIDSTGTGDGLRCEARAHRARDRRENRTGTSMTFTRAGLMAAALAASVAVISAQAPPTPAEAKPAPQTPQQPTAPASQSPSFKAGVDLVSLNVTVTDPAGRYVTDLQQQDFQVFEDGVMQETTFFNRTNLPIALALL